MTVTEGNSGTVNANFTVSLSAPSGQTVSVGYASADGTATAGADYVATGGSLVFNPGTTTRTLTVQTTSDTLDEIDETFFANLADPVNATIAGRPGHRHDHRRRQPRRRISIGDVTVAEGNSGTANAIFTVTLSAASGRTVTVDYATANGTAIAPADYVAAALSTLTFNPGQISRTITVQVNGDVLDEINETFFVNLSNATNATIADNQALGTITDDDAFPTVAVSDAVVIEGDSGTSTATFTVTLNTPSGRGLSVDYATADGTAISPADYAATSGTLDFAAGETTKTGHRPRQRRPAGRGRRDVHAGPLERSQRHDRGPHRARHDQRRRRRCPRSAINDVTVRRGRQRHDRRELHGHPQRRERARRLGQLRTADGTATAPADYALGQRRR